MTKFIAAVLSLVIAIGAGCASPTDPGLRANHPGRTTAAADIDWADFHFNGRDGTELYGQRWRAKSGEPKAIVVIHHGLADHSDRFAFFAERLVHAGYTVWANDMRGHGRSAGPRVDLPSLDDLITDFDAFLAIVRAQEPGRRIFVYGHSVGGHVTTLYTIVRQPDLAGIVLSSPAISLETAPLQAPLLRVLSAVTPNLPAFDLPHAYFSQRSDVVAEMDHDPLIWQAKGPVKTPRALLDGAERIWANTDRLVIPMLALHGSADEATPPSGSRDLVARAASHDKTLRIYEGLKHDLLREPNGAGEQVTEEVIGWLDAHASGQPSTLTSTPWRRLKGDHARLALSLDLDARGEQIRDAEKLGVTGGARFRISAGRAGAVGLGYFGGLDLRAGALDGGYYELDAHLAGISLRTASGVLLGVTSGIGIGGLRGASATHVPLEATLEVPVGAARLLARAGLGWRVGGDEYTDDALGIADEASALVGLRIGRDHRYWGTFVAGGGPMLGVTYRNLGGADIVGVTLGLDFWQGN